MNHIPAQLFFFLVPFLSTASSILADSESPSQDSKGNSAGTCGKIRLAYKIASLCLNDRSVFFRRLFLLASSVLIGVGSQGFSKRCVFAREVSYLVCAQSDRDRGSRYRNGLFGCGTARDFPPCPLCSGSSAFPRGVVNCLAA